MSVPLLAEVVGGELPQLRVYQRDQLVESLAVAHLPSPEERGDVGHGGLPSSAKSTPLGGSWDSGCREVLGVSG
jgi:hypothetical protein